MIWGYPYFWKHPYPNLHFLKKMIFPNFPKSVGYVTVGVSGGSRRIAQTAWDETVLFLQLRDWIREYHHMGVNPKIGGKPPKSSILLQFSIINHPFWGEFSPYFWFNTHIHTISTKKIPVRSPVVALTKVPRFGSLQNHGPVLRSMCFLTWPIAKL